MLNAQWRPWSEQKPCVIKRSIGHCPLGIIGIIHWANVMQGSAKVPLVPAKVVLVVAITQRVFPEHQS
jgi:hypothetical protein